MFHYYRPSRMPSARDDDRSTHVAAIPAGVAATRDLLKAAGDALAFPPYYGANFDAFWDCLRTLEAIAAGRVLLAHADLPALPEDDMETYIEILRDAVLFWRRHADEHVFEVWFPASARRRVERTLEALPPGSEEDE